jgi:endonuclease/exonuclease/phosphatase family metal-dependent hydrolase
MATSCQSFPWSVGKAYTRLYVNTLDSGTSFPWAGYRVSADGQIQFRASFPDARRVCLAGSFTDWQQNPLEMQSQGAGWWEVTSPALPLGMHTYKYLVDGVWFQDPAHDNLRSDSHGGYNSTLLVSHPSLDLGGMNSLRIASLNLHTYQESNAERKLAEIADVFSCLDVHAAALQEVGEHAEQPSLRPNAGEVLRSHLEQRTGVPWYHVWYCAHLGFDVYLEGVSLLSRVPLVGTRLIELGGRTFRRIAVSGQLAGRHSLHLCSVHTSWPSDGGEQEVKLLLSALEGARSSGIPTIIAGDFNSSSDQPLVNQVCDAGYQDAALTQGEEKATFLSGNRSHLDRIDYQFFHPGDKHRSVVGFTQLFHGGTVLGVPQPKVSDHVGLLGIYSLKDTNTNTKEGSS